MRDGSGYLLQICSRRVIRNSGREPADHAEFPTAAIGVRPITEEHKHLLVEPRRPRRRHSDHRVNLVVQPHCPADNLRISVELVSPNPGAEYHYPIVHSAAVLFIQKVTPQYRRYSEGAEESRRYRRPGYLLRRAGAGHISFKRVDGRDFLE